MRSEAAPVTGTRVWTGAAVLAVTLLMGVVSLRALLVSGPWWWLSVLAVLGMCALLAAVRSRARSRLAPTGWGLLAAVLVVGTLYGGQGSGPSLPLPTLETARRLARLASSGAEAVVEGRIPVVPTRGLELLVVLGVLGAVLVMDLLALGLGRAGASGLVLAAILTPAALFSRMPGFVVLVLAGIGFLLLLTLTRPSAASAGRGSRSEVGPAIGLAALVTVVALALGPLASVMPFYGSVRGPGSWGSGGLNGPLQLSTDLDMRSSLAARSDRPLLRYTTDNPALGPLRMYTMTDFDGSQWRRGSEPVRDALDPAEGLLWPTGDPLARDDSADVEELDEISIEVGDLDQDRLPLPIDPRVADVSGRWLYDPVRDEVVGDDVRTRGLSYVVRVASRDLSAQALEADTVGGRFAEGAPALELPQTPFLAEVSALAAEITADETTSYDQAVALQMYLRDSSRFRYSTRVPDAQTEDAVYDFLNQRTGYCVQFATAMAVMARTLGIPARIGVGFLPGRANTAVSGEFVVTAQQSHAWPELYFDDAGWVRFEPTPAVQTGAPPVYADPFGGLPISTPTPTPGSSVGATGGPQAEQPQTQGGGGTRVSIGDTSVPLLLVLGVGVLVVAGVTLAAWALVVRRRRRHAPAHQGPEVAWAALRSELAARGLTWSDAVTPRQAAELVHERHARVLADHPGDAATIAAVDQAGPALASLVGALESERYAPHPASWDGDALDAMVGAVVAPLDAATDRSTSAGAPR